jgi:predicted negative regulator of RcsB-dependent stress response/outer membrane protein assembly factor BamD (BamD/ComL family)
MSIKIKKYLSFCSALSLIVIVNSCGMWNNFTTYYNRFYLAESTFEQGEENIELNQEKPLFQFKEEKLTTKGNADFNEVIKFSSKILQFNKDTKYVNEAIYMIAKSYYYKGEYNKALRKFIELDNLRDEDYGLSTKLWIAKCEMQMRNFDSALEHLEEVKNIAITNEDEEILFQVYVAEISYLIYREDFSKAINKIEELVNQDLKDEVKSEVTYELGMLYVSLSNYEKAVYAFKLVEEGSPTFKIEFMSKLEYAKAIKHIDKSYEALQILNDMRDDTKYEPHWDIIDLEIAQIELESGSVELALEIFYSVDTGYTKNESSGIAAFMQGDIMEHIYMDFDSAKILYEKVATKKAPSEYRLEARLKANLLKSRKEYIDNIFDSKMGYRYLLDTTFFREDSIAYAGYVARKDSAMQVAKENEESQEEEKVQTKGRSTRGTAKALKAMFKYEEDSLFTFEPKLPIISADSMKYQITKNEYELGNLYFTDLLVPDSALFYYNDIVTNYSGTRFQAKTLYALGSYYLTLDNKENADSLFKYVYDNYTSDPIAKAAATRLGMSIEEINSDPALEKYYYAEELLDKKEYYDAIEELNSIYKTFPESQYSSKALYSIGWIYENKLSDYEGAVDFYDTLKVKFPKTEYAREVSSKLLFFHSTKKAIQDSIARFDRAIADSIWADSLAQIKIDTLAVPNSIIDSLAIKDSSSIIDSLAIIDSSSIVDSLAIKDSSSIVDSINSTLKDSTTNVLYDSLDTKKEKQDDISNETLSDSAKAANIKEQTKTKLLTK